MFCFLFLKWRYHQKRRHIVAELQKKKEAAKKKTLTVANLDPNANDKQRLLQLDPTVVGSASTTMGSSKQFTNEPVSVRASAGKPSELAYTNREYQSSSSSPPPPIPPKDNRPPYYNENQRSLKSSRERMHVPYESDSRFSSTNTQYPEMISMHEQAPRVVVRTVRDDINLPVFNQQIYDDSAQTFVSIPVQIEHSNLHQRFVPPPYHSDPYYPNVNS